MNRIRTLRRIAQASLLAAAIGLAMPPAHAAKTGTAGGGNCSVWASIKSLVYGVDCTYF